MTNLTPGSYAVATGLIGFPSDTLRVKVVEVLSDTTVLIRTADLRDAGTPLALDASQVTQVPDEVTVGLLHRDGFVIMEGA